MIKQTLAKRLLLWIIPVSLLGIYVLGISAYFISKRHIMNNINKEIAMFGGQAAMSLADFFKQRIHDLETIAETPLLTDYHANLDFGLAQEAEAYRREMEKYLQRFSQRSGVYHRLLYVNEKGLEICKIVSSELAPDRGGFKDPGLISQIRQMGPAQPYQSSLTDDPLFGKTVVYGKALYGPTGAFRGVLILECGMKPVTDILNGLNIGPSGWAYMTDPAKNSVLGKRPATLRPEETLSSETEIQGTPWKISVEAKSSEFLAPLNQIRNLTLWTGGLCGAFVVLFVVFRVRSLTRPIKELVDAAQGLQAGDLSARVQAAGDNDEIGTLSQAFNTMAESLEQRTGDLQESEARYRSVLENSPVAILGLSREQRIAMWNRGAEAIFGHSADFILGKPLEVIFPADGVEKFRELLAAVMSQGSVRDYPAVGITQDGQRLDIQISWGGRFADFWMNKEWTVVIRDVTEAKKLEQQIIRSEKLSAVGQLLSSVAHELNNPLQAVTGYAQLLSAQMSGPGAKKSTRKDLKMIVDSAMRCRKILDNLLLFVRHGDAEKQPVNIRKALSASIDLLQYKLKKAAQIELKCEIPKRLPPVKADIQQIQQVFVNIINNACDALTAGWDGEKKISIRAASQEQSVRVEISDSGPGIPEDARKRIFEPFFTTKPPGRGTGLGLSVCRQIIHDHGGLMGFKSQPGQGTTFFVELPAAGSPAQTRGLRRYPGELDSSA